VDRVRRADLPGQVGRGLCNQIHRMRRGRMRASCMVFVLIAVWANSWTCKGGWNSRGGFGVGGPCIAMGEVVRIFEVDPGRWRVEWGSGLGLEVVLLFSRTVAFWRWGGELFAEVPIGEA